MALCFPTPAATSAIAVNYTKRMITSVLPTTRELVKFVELMDFRADGTIQPLKLTGPGVGALRPPHVAEKDMSIGADATASSFRPTVSIPGKYDPAFARTESFSPENAVDGSNGSRWTADEQDPTPWLQVDLGGVHAITRTEAYFVTPTAGHSYRIPTHYASDGVSALSACLCDERYASPLGVSRMGVTPRQVNHQERNGYT